MNTALWQRSNKVNNFVTMFWPPKNQVAYNKYWGMLVAGILSGLIKTTTWLVNNAAYYHSLEEEMGAGVVGEDR